MLGVTLGLLAAGAGIVGAPALNGSDTLYGAPRLCATNGAGTSVQATSEALEIGLDGSIVITASATTTCGNTGSLAGTANGLAVQGQTFTVNPGGAAYAIADSLDVLRLIYFGIDHENVADCNGAIRRSLGASWGNLFSTSCAVGNTACSGGLWHACRQWVDCRRRAAVDDAEQRPTAHGIPDLADRPVDRRRDPALA